MIIRSRFTVNRVAAFVCAIAAFAWMDPYFFWRSYSEFSYLFKHALLVLVFAFTGLVVIGRAVNGKVKASSVSKWICQLLFLGYALYLVATNLDQNLNLVFSEVLKCVSISCFLTLSIEEQKDAYVMMRKLFIFFLVPSLILYGLLQLGISIPLGKLPPPNANKAPYLHFPFLVTTANTSGRFMGILDEPGATGTFAAFFLAKDSFRLKGKRGNTVLLIAGILSRSLAFFVLMAVSLVFDAFHKKSVKRLLYMVALALFVVVFIFVDFNIPILTEIKARLMSDAWDNRTSSYYLKEFDMFLNGDKENIIYGMGIAAKSRNAMMRSGCSWRDIIYDSGIVGFALTIFLIVFSTMTIYMKKPATMYVLPFLVVFLASIYQRSAIMTIAHFTILFGGSAALQTELSAKEAKRESSPPTPKADGYKRYGALDTLSSEAGVKT